jgi:hypothetical protein
MFAFKYLLCAFGPPNSRPRPSVPISIRETAIIKYRECGDPTTLIEKGEHRLLQINDCNRRLCKYFQYVSTPGSHRVGSRTLCGRVALCHRLRVTFANVVAISTSA